MDQEGKGALPPDIVRALEGMAVARLTLLTELRAALTPDAELESEARREDLGLGALHETLRAWGRLAPELPEGDVALRVRLLLFPNGLGGVSLEPRPVGATADAVLTDIARLGLEADLARLGVSPLLEHLRQLPSVDARRARPGDPPGPALKRALALVAPLATLEDAMRAYVIAVRMNLQESAEAYRRADALLAPLTEGTLLVTSFRVEGGF